MSLFFKIFSKSKLKNSSKTDNDDAPLIKKKRLKHQAQEVDISFANYIPLPKSPPVWEVKEEKYGKDWDWLDNKINYQVYAAYSEQKYNKVISYYDQISEENLRQEPGDLLLKAYRKIIQKWRNKDRHKVAIKWSAEMFEKLPHLVIDTDRRRHNNIITQLDKAGLKHSYKKYKITNPTTESKPKFKLETQSNWEISNITSIPKEDRPDTAFKDHFFVKNGILSIDKRGKAKGFENFKAVLSICNAEDQITTTGLEYDIYRLYLNPINSCYVFLSSECFMHIYNSKLELLNVFDLKAFPQIKKFEQFLSSFDELKRLIRCVAVSPSLDRYLFTIVDEAWCIDKWGNIIWSLKSPVEKRIHKIFYKSRDSWFARRD